MTRLEDLTTLANTNFDLLIIGGGIHGASAAKIAAYNGLKTALIEKNDYSSGTSSRSSKMAHGGLRYLAYGDFKQVFEGVKAREKLFINSRHLTHRTEFLIPTRNYLDAYKYLIGLKIYNFFNTKKDSNKFKEHSIFKNYKNFKTSVSYTDGLMNDSRLVIENILAARDFGATCLNYCEAINYNKNIIARDSVTGNEFEIKAKKILNLSGNHVNQVLENFSIKPKYSLRFSQGIHIMYDQIWDNPAILFPRKKFGNLYWILPYYNHLMLGTTERESKLIEDPQPLESEINLIENEIESDIPGLIDFNKKYYIFAGLRALPCRSNSKSTSELSRKHLWDLNSNILTLYGGKFTTAEWTALSGLKILFGSTIKEVTCDLPGSNNFEQNVIRMFSHFDEIIKQETINFTLDIIGARSSNIHNPMLIDNFIFKDLIDLILKEEQIVYFEDLYKRRLGLQYLPFKFPELEHYFNSLEYKKLI